MPLNVLLMLSSRQPPDPEREITHHSEACARGESPVYLATTRVLTELIPGESAVAFYGDSGMENRLLGVGRFEGYLPIASLRADELRKTHALYSETGVPASMRGFVMLSQVRLAKRGETLDSFGESVDGQLRAGGEKLKMDKIPFGPARTAVYFWTKHPVPFKE